MGTPHEPKICSSPHQKNSSRSRLPQPNFYSPSSKVHPPPLPLNNNFHIRTPIKTSFLAAFMAPATLLSTSFLLVNIFALIFLYFASILNTKTKYILFVMNATGSFNAKNLFKNNYEKTLSRIATFL